jgi:transcription elongation factor Elf1
MIGINIVIVNEKPDFHFDYYGKCPHCGHVEASGTIGHWCGTHMRERLGTKRCSKCGTQYEMSVDNTR